MTRLIPSCAWFVWCRGIRPECRWRKRERGMPACDESYRGLLLVKRSHTNEWFKCAILAPTKLKLELELPTLWSHDLLRPIFSLHSWARLSFEFLSPSLLLWKNKNKLELFGCKSIHRWIIYVISNDLRSYDLDYFFLVKQFHLKFHIWVVLSCIRTGVRLK